MSVTDNNSPAMPAETLPNRRGRSRVLVYGALALALTLTACGGSSPDTTADQDDTAAASSAASDVTQESDNSTGSAASGAPTDTDICALVSKDEAEEAVGASLEDGESKGEIQLVGLVGSCVYRGTDASQGPTVVNMIVLGTTVPRSVFDNEILGDMADGQEVAGLGEIAYSVPGIVVLFDQGLVLSLQIVKEQVPADTAVLADLLGTALDRADALR